MRIVFKKPQISIRSRRLDMMRRLTIDPTIVQTNVGEQLLLDMRTLFAKEGAYFGRQRWWPWAENTIFGNKLRGGPDKILGSLWSTFKYRTGKTRMLFFSDSKLVAYHTRGNRKGWWIPKREFAEGEWGVYPSAAHGKWIRYKKLWHPGYRRRPIMPPPSWCEKRMIQATRDFIFEVKKMERTP